MATFTKTIHLRKFAVISLRVLLGIFILIALLWGFLQTTAGQNWLAGQITKKLSKDLQTRISIQHVSIGLFNFNKMDLEGVLVEDQKKDTLLYAGKFQIRITDWFFFRDKAELKYVGLEDASIRLNRTDSVWNYQFLESYFSGGGSSSGKKSSGVHFDLKQVSMRNVSFEKKDAWIGTDMTARIGALEMDADEISATHQAIRINSLVLDNPYFSIYEYTGRKPSDTTTTVKDTTTQKPAAAPSWIVSLANVKINNGRFRDDHGDRIPDPGYFDGAHLDFTNITGKFENVGWSSDTLTGTIDLTAKERSGLVVKSLKAKTTVHPQAMIFDQLFLQTNRSTLTDYFAMRFKSIGSMNDFIHAVTMEGHFDHSTISSDDIAFFAPEIKSWKKNIKIDGKVKGTVDALSSPDLEVWAGNNTYVSGAVSLVGLPNINETLINIEAKDLRTTYSDAVSFIPAIRKITTPALNKLSYLRFQGTYTGFINDFVTYGNVQTNLGSLRTDLNMKFPERGEPVYTGSISTEGFQLGSFINNKDLGLVGFNGHVKGKGFEWKTLDLDIDGTIHRLQYIDYTYRNIKAKGNLTNRLFRGDFEMKDPNADVRLKGLVDLTRSKPFFNVTADIGFANLQALQLSREDLRLNGRFDLNLEASSLSDLLGTARISNATLISKGKPLSFDSLTVTSAYVNGLKTLHAVSNEFDATVYGDFDLQGLPDAFTLFLHRYYPSYIRAPRFVKPQVFTFDITTGMVEDYIQLIDSRLTGFNNSHLSGALNTNANTMAVDADVPFVQFDKYQVSELRLKGSGDLTKLVLTGDMGNAQIGDSILFPQTSFSVQAANDVSDFTLNTTSNQAINQANISGQVKTFSDGATLTFYPSNFILNGKTWTIEPGGDLNFRKNTVVQGQVLLKESNQEIRVWTQPDPEGSWNNLHVALSKLNLGDVSPLLMRSNRVEGLLSGEIVVEDPQNRFNIRSNLRTEELRVDNDSIGQVEANINYNNKTGLLSGQGRNLDPEHSINFDLAMNFKDSANTFQDQIHTRLSNFELKYLDRFLGNLFSDINGYATGNFDIIGEGSDRNYLAKARLHNAGFKVNFTQVSYTIDDTEIQLKKDTIDLNNIRIRDKEGNSAILKGNILHHGFSDMYYDLSVQTESRQMELLNTTAVDNEQFYGRAKGSGQFVLVGPQSDMLMNIDAKSSETDTSYITLPPAKSRESGQANFMVERTYGREMDDVSSGSTSSLNYDINITATPLLNVEVILDELTGDRIRGKGSGNLRITAGTFEPLALQGRYNIDEGNYIFTFQSFLGKSFVLKKGGTNYIEWNGDPYEGTVRLEAVYTANEVNFAPLATSLTNVRDDVNVAAVLSGNLFRPDFAFKLELPNTKPQYNTPEVQFALQQIEKNPNELNKQVTYLIVFNSFAPFENATASAGTNPFGEFTYSTISGLLFGKVNEQLNRILSKILPNSASFNFTGSLYNRNLVDANSKNVFRLPNQSNLNVSLGLPLFNDRAHITLGATLDVPLAAGLEQTIHLLPDVTLELLVNQTGSLRATFFYRQNVDFLTGATPSGIIPRRYGASIGYGREFDNLKELFGSRKKKAVIPDTTAKPSDTTGTH